MAVCTPEAAPVIRWATPLTHDDARDTDSGPIRYRCLSCVYDETEKDAVKDPEGHCFLTAEEPRDVDAGIGDAAWKAAMDEEMASIIDNDAWELARLPTGHKVIGLKWVYKIKRDPPGNGRQAQGPAGHERVRSATRSGL